MQAPLRDKIAAVISFAVVLPLLPATPTMGRSNSARQAIASCCKARKASGTTICVSGTGIRRSTNAPAAPAACAAATNSAPSKFGPRSATNSAPGCNVRLSLDTAAKLRSAPLAAPALAVPLVSVPPTACAASCRVRFMPPLPAGAALRAGR